ncbi:MAG TPA: serine hydrolase domain-containing protein [Thermoanaerobaculia bacterium]
MLKRALLVLLVALAALPSFAQSKYEAEIRQLEQFIEAHMRETKMPALSVAIAKGDFVWSKGFGLADVENRVPATAQSSYRMASVTKPMTAVGVMKLVEQGKIDLDAEVQTYVPYFPKKTHPVTIRQLLAHLGGISHYKNYSLEGRIREPKTTKEAIAIFQDFDLVNEPGTEYRYSSYGFNLLGAVIEGASGRSYGDYMRDEVWGPLGMSDTRMDDPRALIPNRVRGYVLHNGSLRNSEYVDISSRFAGGGTRSTVLDMLKFVQGLDQGKLLKAESLDAMWTAQRTRKGEPVRYGLGFGIAHQSGRYVVAHGGAQQETRTDLGYIPAARFGYALATNFEDANLDILANRIAAIFLGDAWTLTYYAPAHRDLLRTTGTAWNQGLAHFERYRKTTGSDPAAAFRAFKAGKPQDALVEAGAYMASELARSGVDLEKYHRAGQLAFFDDYIRLYKTSRSIPRTHRFEATFEQQIATLRRDWDRIATDELRLFTVSSVADLDRLEAMRFGGSAILPDYSSSMLDIGQEAALGKDLKTATRVATSMLTLYPESDRATGFGGIIALLNGDTERGRTLLTKSRTLAPNGYASSNRLTAIAGELERVGYKEAAVVLREYKQDK